MFDFLFGLFRPLISQNLTIVFGQFGAGKTMYTVQSAFEAHRKGTIVISNAWLAFPHVRWTTLDELMTIVRELQERHNAMTSTLAGDEYLRDHGMKREKNKEFSYFILLDEASLYFGARNWAENMKDPDILAFFVQPRKLGCTIAIIAQDAEMVDVHIRRLAQEVVEFRKALFGFFRVGRVLPPEYMRAENIDMREKIPSVRSRWYWHTFRRLFLGFKELYYTREMLGRLSISRGSAFPSVSAYLEKKEVKTNKIHPDIRKKFNEIKDSPSSLSPGSEGAKRPQSLRSPRGWSTRSVPTAEQG